MEVKQREMKKKVNAKRKKNKVGMKVCEEWKFCVDMEPDWTSKHTRDEHSNDGERWKDELRGNERKIKNVNVKKKAGRKVCEYMEPNWTFKHIQGEHLKMETNRSNK